MLGFPCMFSSQSLGELLKLRAKIVQINSNGSSRHSLLEMGGGGGGRAGGLGVNQASMHNCTNSQALAVCWRSLAPFSRHYLCKMIQ
jgi:hypothetical protein